jgi:signal transduction histidine kinase
MLGRLRLAYDAEQRAAQELSRALQSKNDFIADASHELRTPLTVIRGNAEIGLGSPGEPIHREVLADISTEANRMSRLVDDLLFLARSDAGAPPLERELLPARRLVERLLKPADVLAKQHGARIAATSEVEGLLEVDPARIEQAVLILVDNAAKHSPEAGEIVLAARSRHGQLMISVVDQGPGIPPDELPLIFDRFYQIGKRRTRKKGGAGLGLSIARSIVEGHGGSIGVSSNPERGTRVTIVLPLISLPEVASPPESSPVRFPPDGATANGTSPSAARSIDAEPRRAAPDPLPSRGGRRH